jgi:hypothetical protein
MTLTLLMIMTLTLESASDAQSTLDAHSNVSVLPRTARANWAVRLLL